jgi:hypothetical protein
LATNIWKPVNVFKSDFDIDVVFIQLEKSIICVKSEDAKVYLISRIDLDDGIAPNNIVVEIFESMISVIFINKSGASVYREYSISNPFSPSKIVERATFGY